MSCHCIGRMKNPNCPVHRDRGNYELEFVRRLQEALGYEDSDEIVDDQAFGDLTVMCNHAANRIERLTRVNERLELDNDYRYKNLVFRFIDRMNDVCDIDPADKIVNEFVEAFIVIWDEEEKSMTQKTDDGGVEELSEGLDIGDACPECGQEWTGTL